MQALSTFDDAHHELFLDQGYVRLGKVLSPDELAALQQRIDDIMLGRIRYEHMRLQVVEEDGEVRRTMGNEVQTLAYRRIDDLEQDPLFLAYIQHPLFHQITRRYIGEEVSVFRSMFMNKPPELRRGLPWHQDVGIGWRIDTNPIVTVWTALDDATTATGCMQIVPGSNQHGIINERHFLPAEQEAQYARPEAVIDLEAEAGEAILLHNFLLHRSGPQLHRVGPPCFQRNLYGLQNPLPGDRPNLSRGLRHTGAGPGDGRWQTSRIGRQVSRLILSR